MITVMTSGVFDLIHPGHIYHLQQARAMGDRLVVALTADSFVNKGPGRPVFNTQQRAALLRELRCVDEVLVSTAPIPYHIIERICPAIYVKHEEYKDRLPEQGLVESLGGRVLFTDWKAFSSSDLFFNHREEYK